MKTTIDTDFSRFSNSFYSTFTNSFLPATVSSINNFVITKSQWLKTILNSFQETDFWYSFS